MAQEGRQLQARVKNTLRCRRTRACSTTGHGRSLRSRPCPAAEAQDVRRVHGAARVLRGRNVRGGPRLLPLTLANGTCLRLRDAHHEVERSAPTLTMAIDDTEPWAHRRDEHRGGDGECTGVMPIGEPAPWEEPA